MFCPQPYTSQRILGHKSRCNDFTHAKAVRHTPSEQVCASVSTMWMSFFAYRRCQEVVFELCVGFFDPVCRHDVGKNPLQNMEIKIRESWWPDEETAFLHSRVSFFSAFFYIQVLFMRLYEVENQTWRAVPQRENHWPRYHWKKSLNLLWFFNNTWHDACLIQPCCTDELWASRKLENKIVICHQWSVKYHSKLSSSFSIF